MISKTELLLMVKDLGFLLYDAGDGPEVLHTEPLRYSQKCFERFAEMVIDHYRSKSNLNTALQQSLEALNSFLSDDLRPYQAAKVYDALKSALEQAEPVRCPAKPLTKEHLLYIYNQLPNWGMDLDSLPPVLEKFARLVEKAHGIE